MPKTEQILLDRKKNLYLKMTKSKGRGVFCRHNIKKDEVLEVTPALLLNEKQTEDIADTLLMDYVFSADGLSAQTLARANIKDADDASCVVMGIASYCNHDENPNAEVIWEEVEGKVFFSLRTTKAIPKNTEICTSYGDGWFDERQ